jgi:hypothetical protein
VRCCDPELPIEIGDSYEDYGHSPDDTFQFARSPIKHHNGLIWDVYRFENLNFFMDLAKRARVEEAA